MAKLQDPFFAGDDPSDPLAARLSSLLASPGKAVEEKTFDHFLVVPGPIGPCFVVRSSLGVRHVFLATQYGDDPDFFASSYAKRYARPLLADHSSPDSLSAALHKGKAGSIAVDLSSLTEFEQSVLRFTQQIPLGEVRPYAWVANGIGAPRAVRAVGTALGRNPVPFLIPCHRVVRSDGDIGNYYFGPSHKEAILTEEGVSLVGTSTLGPVGARFVGSDTTKIVCYPTCHAARRITDAHRVAFPPCLVPSMPVIARVFPVDQSEHQLCEQGVFVTCISRVR